VFSEKQAKSSYLYFYFFPKREPEKLKTNSVCTESTDYKYSSLDPVSLSQLQADIGKRHNAVVTVCWLGVGCMGGKGVKKTRACGQEKCCGLGWG
jgi:hypothetical protein